MRDLTLMGIGFGQRHNHSRAAKAKARPEQRVAAAARDHGSVRDRGCPYSHEHPRRPIAVYQRPWIVYADDVAYSHPNRSKARSGSSHRCKYKRR